MYIEACLDSLLASDYPRLDVIVCDDGSTDTTVELARRYPFKVLALPFVGLSAARNAALLEAKGEIVAYLDADAACHPDWPYHLALSMEDSAISATGGPNLPFPDAGLVERAASLSPGAPAEVLLTDTRAEHVPGCNMAFRKKALEGVGAFNREFTSAGDDVDVCWKLLDAGKEIGFSPAAQVVHHRRGTIRGYLKQQRGYGRAEKLLSGPHRRRFNQLGQARWRGFIYGGSRLLPALLRPVVYTGYMGMAPFQPAISRRAETAGAWATALLPLGVPLALVGAGLALFSLWWLLVPGAVTALAVAYGVAVSAAVRVGHRETHPWRLRALVGTFHLLQPIVRTWGRMTGHRAKAAEYQVPHWAGDRSVWLDDLVAALEEEGCTVKPGRPGDSWDLMPTSGVMTSVRITTAVAWRWDPRHRASYRGRPLLWVLLAVGAAVGLVGSALGWAVAGAAMAWLAASAVLLRRRIASALSKTTHGSRS